MRPLDRSSSFHYQLPGHQPLEGAILVAHQDVVHFLALGDLVLSRGVSRSLLVPRLLLFLSVCRCCYLLVCRLLILLPHPLIPLRFLSTILLLRFFLRLSPSCQQPFAIYICKRSKKLLNKAQAGTVSATQNVTYAGPIHSDPVCKLRWAKAAMLHHLFYTCYGFIHSLRLFLCKVTDVIALG